MRTAAVALACFLGAAATTPAAAETRPALNLPPFPSSPPAPAAVAPAADLHALTTPHLHAEPPRQAHARVCFNQAEAREKIVQHRLTDPVSATRSGRAEGEALRTRLCRWRQDEFVYEVYVLRRDGRVLHLYVNAQSGQALSGADLADHK